MRSEHRPTIRERSTGTLVATACVVFALSATACSPMRGDEASSGGDSVTVIATASPDATSTPVVLEPTELATKRGYKLVFGDEFIGPRLDKQRWTTSLPWGNTTLKEDQRYSPNAVSQQGGVMTITASRQPSSGKQFQSGVVTTEDRFSFKYGYVEARMQPPSGAGLWSAFWLLSTVAENRGEIDILESLGQDPRQAYQVLHFGTSRTKGKSLHVSQEPDLSEEFHTFAVDWGSDHIVWYVDGVERHRVTENVPDVPMIVITNLAVGGERAWSGPPDSDTPFPAKLNVDYIRVFQRE